MEITEALKQLDPQDDEHWTGDGLPKIGAVHKLTGNRELRRGEITEAAPHFTRENPVIEPSDPEKQEGDPPADDDHKTDPPADDTGKKGKPKAKDQDELEEAQDEVAKAEAELSKLMKAKDELDRRVARAQERRDKLVTEREREQTPHSNQQEIMRHLQHQKEVAARRQPVQPTMAPPSQLDASMARNTKRGAKRPEYPSSKKE